MRKYSLKEGKRKYLLILLSVIVAVSLLIYKNINALDNNLTKKEKVEDFQYMYIEKEDSFRKSRTDIVYKSYTYRLDCQ